MTKRYAVIGDPVAHSLSPLMHTGWIADHGIDATYEAHLVRSDDPVAAIRSLTQFAGMNVTAPYKEAAANAADHREDSVANVLRREQDGSLFAFNTDGDGFLASLEAGGCFPTRAHKKTALILGAGGAARAISRALTLTFETVLIANRTPSHAEDVARGFSNAQARDWSALGPAFAEADLIVQATSLGMAGSQSPAWPFEMCGAKTIAADIVYRPLETPFLAAAKARGLETVDGLGMLIHQGALSFEIWHGVRPDIAKARARLEAALA